MNHKYIIFVILVSFCYQGCGGGSSASPPVPRVPPPVTISPATFANATVGQSYSAQAIAGGGTPPYTLTETTSTPLFPSGQGATGTPCQGLTLNLIAGSLSGTPVNAGTCGPFTIRASDSSSPQLSASATFSITINNPVPTASAISPVRAVAGDPAFTLTVDGTNFVSTSVVQWNGSNRPTTFVSAGRVTAAITAADIGAAGTTQVTVVNAAPGGGTTATQPFTIHPAVTVGPATFPFAVVTQMYTVQLQAAGGIGPLTLTETTPTPLFPGGVGTAGSPCEGLGLTLATGTVGGTPVRSGICGPFRIQAVDSATPPHTFSADLNIQVQNPVPSITTLNPAQAVSGDPGFTMTVNGTGFLPSSTVLWNGSARPSSYVSSTQITATIPGSDVFYTGTGMVTVVNATPGGGTSGARILTITPKSPAVTLRLNVSNSGVQANNNSSLASTVFLSGSGRYAVFESQADNLVPGDQNVGPDGFLFDRDSDGNGVFDEPGGTSIAFACVDSFKFQLLAWCHHPHISSSGRFVVFAASLFNLNLSNLNPEPDIFVHDRDTDEDGTFDEPGATLTVRVSLAPGGGNANDYSLEPKITPGGRYVIFSSVATNLVAGDTNTVSDIFVRDRDTDNDGIFDESGAVNTVRVSVADDGSQANEASLSPVISADGRFVAFYSAASNLVSGDVNNQPDIFVHDRDADGNGIFDEPGGIRTVLVSVATDGTQADAGAFGPSISADGRFVSFGSISINLPPLQSRLSPSARIYVRDRDADGNGIYDEPGGVTTKVVSVADDGTPSVGSDILGTSLSAQGRFVGFPSSAANLVANDSNGFRDAFAHDRDVDQDFIFDEPGAFSTKRVSVSVSRAEAGQDSFGPSLSSDGRWAIFVSVAANLVPNDTNGFGDVFVARTGFDPVHSAPRIITLAPSNTTSGNPTLTLEIRGSGFEPLSEVLWNGSKRPTVYVSSTRLQVRIPAADFALPGTVSVMVVTPPPGGGQSSTLTFTIN